MTTLIKMTQYTYSLVNNFTNGINKEQFEEEIQELISTNFYVKIHADVLTVIFVSPLSGNDQSLLNGIIANHDPTQFDNPCITSQLIKDDEIYVVNHFPDPTYKRRSSLNEETTDTFDYQAFTMSSGYSGDYTLDNPVLSQLNNNSFILVGAGYAKGSNISNTGTATASSTTQPAANANDNNSTTFWYNATSEPAVGAWWRLDFGTVRGIHSVEVEWYSTTYYATDVSIQWSNDGKNWNLALRQQGITYTSAGNTTGNYTFPDFTAPIFARYWRFLCNASNNATYFIMKEARLFEAVGSGFSTIGTATITNNTPSGQVDTFSWAQINSATIQGTFPAGTTTKMLISFDGQSSWVYWNGSAWITESLISNSTMTPAIFNALTTANFAEMSGLNSNNSKTIDVKFNISTTSDTLSPIINGISFNITTVVFQEQSGEQTVRVRNISSRKTEIKNISGVDKIFHICITK